jgi:hypothetical protein
MSSDFKEIFGMFYENFDRICKTQGTSPSAAAVAIGKARTLPAGWKKNHTIPKEDELKALAEHLHCSVADFFADDSHMRFGTSEESAINNLYATTAEDIELDENEEELLRIYEQCSIKQRNKLMMLAYKFEEEEL